MKTRRLILTGVLLSMASASIAKTARIGQWQRFEQRYAGPDGGNPFTDVTLTARFWRQGGDTVTIRGFYDGRGEYVIRFMPMQKGIWHFATSSNRPELNARTGDVECVAAAGDHHGPVTTRGLHDFAYTDSKPYYPVGTTAYAWVHMKADVQEMTLRSLAEAQFNKVRMCVFPKHYQLCRDLPERYPFKVTGKKDGKLTFDFSQPDPEFFRNLETRIDQLARIGCEADLILFHPYDKGYWGFDEMTMEQNRFYLSYLQARLASFANVWWSMANEYDYVKAKTIADWHELIREVRANDPYGHLLSIHGSTATYFDYLTEGITHTSIQDEGPVLAGARAAIVRNIYPKPVIFDEVAYEGNLTSRWGRLSGQEMLYRMWNGLMCGTYVTHGECYQRHEGDYDTIFWAKGGPWRGESWKRVPFMRQILADLPHPLEMADVSRDDLTSTAGEGYYMIYFGKEIQDAWLFNLPARNAGYPPLEPGTRFRMEIIDTWDMTVTPVDGVFEVGEKNDYRHYDRQLRKVWLPLKPYLMLRIKALPA
ncbi:MAG: DUF5060 domain-containing protein [Prevotella sp.]|nr:DUF5060 domain-containing protein [Prevotella sp.]